MPGRRTKRETSRRNSRCGSGTVSAAIAGALLFGMGIAALMGIITAEALYPAGYSTGGSEISDLGATRPPDSVIHQPSATIFNSVMMVGGVFTIVAAFFLYRAFRRTVPAVLLGLFGLGALGVGVFPGDHEPAHSVFALMTFVTGGLAAIAAYMVETSPFRYYSVLLGAVALVSMILYAALGDANPMAGLGNGGIERWVTYPILLWVTGFGGHLMARGPS